jgi:LacI family transcriptional regulator
MSLGFRHYAACISGDILFGRLRRDAFVRRVTATGRAVAACEVGRTEPMTAASADDLATLDRWLAGLPKPTAVFCANDARALQVLSAARRLGLGVPDEVAVLGAGDDELANLVSGVPLSSIAIPSVQIGFTAASILEGMLNGADPSPPKVTRLAPLCVVPRASTDVTFLADADIAAAVRFIRANVAAPLTVADVLEHVPIGRRSLERRFRAAVGRSVATEIRRTRVERAKQLLASTRLTVEEVAEASGFTSATLLGVAFGKSVGRTPTAYRREVTFTQPKRS